MSIALSRVLWNGIDIISPQYRIVNQTEVSTYLTIPKKLFRLIWENEVIMYVLWIEKLNKDLDALEVTKPPM